jgi:hypothetical protein
MRDDNIIGYRSRPVSAAVSRQGSGAYPKIIDFGESLENNNREAYLSV